MLVIVGTRTDEHSLRSQVIIGSESDCLLEQFACVCRAPINVYLLTYVNVWISDSEAEVKEKKSGGVAGGGGRCEEEKI